MRADKTLWWTSVPTAVALLAAGATLVACGSVSPEPEDPEVILLEGALGNTFLREGEETAAVARLRIKTRPIQGSARPPIHLAVVVDTSGSMEGDPIDHARGAALSILDMLDESDRLSVVAFHSRAEVLLPSTELGDADLVQLRGKISDMEARGTTDMRGGFQAGLEQLMQHFDSNVVTRLVLLGDGIPNDESGITALAQAAGERGIAVTSLGLGLFYNETLMGEIAQLSGGSFHYVEQSEQIAEVFREEVLKLQRVLARNAVVSLQPGPGVLIQGVVGQQVATTGSQVRITIGQITEGDVRDLIVRMTVRPQRAGAPTELLDATLTFTDGVADAGQLERNVYLGARATNNEEDIAGGRNEEVERAAAEVQAAAATVQAIAIARQGNIAEARAILSRAQVAARVFAARSGSVVRTAASMDRLEAALPQIAAESAPSSSPGSGAVGPADAPPPVTIDEDDARSRGRRAHDDAMNVLGY